MRRILSFVLTAAMVLSLVPTPAVAEVVDELDIVPREENGEVLSQEDEGLSEESLDGDAQESKQDVVPQKDEEPEVEAQSEEPAVPDSEPDSDLQVVEETDPTEQEASVADDELSVQTQSVDDIELIQDGFTTSNSILFPNERYTIQSANGYVNHAQTITFNYLRPFEEQGGPLPHPDDYPATFDVVCSLAEGTTNNYSVLDGIAYQKDGELWALPNGVYTITFQTDGGEYTTQAEYSVNMGYIFKQYYGVGSAARIQKFGATGAGSLDGVDVSQDLKMDLSFTSATAIADASDVVVSKFALFKADASKEELAQQLAAGDTASWPSLRTWAWSDARNKHKDETIGWKSDSYADQPATVTLSGQKGGTVRIPKANLAATASSEHGTLSNGMYWPVLKATINGEIYVFVYDPIQINASDVPRQDPRITTGDLVQGLVGTKYSAKLVGATGSSTPGTFSWSITSGSLPAGLTLNAKTGAIAGTPTKAGTSSITVRLTETVDGVARSASKKFTITIANKITLGTVSYDAGSFSLNGTNKTIAVSVPINANLTDWALGLGLSTAELAVVQEAADGSEVQTTSDMEIRASELWGAGTIKATAGRVKRIEVRLSVVSNSGDPVYETDANGQSKPMVLVAAANDPNITLLSTATFPAYSFTEDVAVNEVRLRYWKYSGTATPTGVQVANLSDWSMTTLERLVPGDYAFVVEGFVQSVDQNGEWAYDSKGNPIGEWLDVMGGSNAADAVEGTSPHAYVFHVAHNANVDVDVRFTAAGFDFHTVTALFQMANGSFAEDAARYSVAWYRRTTRGDVLVGTGNSVTLAPSADPLYVQVIPSGSASLDWATTERLPAMGRTLTVRVNRKPHVKATVNLTLASGIAPKSGAEWGTLTVKRPLASGYSTKVYWPTASRYEIADVTPGTTITFSPALNLECGPVTTTVPQNTTSNITLNLTAPKAKGIVSFGALTLRRADDLGTESDNSASARSVAIGLNDAQTTVEVTKGSGSNAKSVPFYVLDNHRLMIQDDEASLVSGAKYSISVKRMDDDATWSFFGTWDDYAATQTFEATLSGAQASATLDGRTFVSAGTAIVPIQNRNNTYCSLLLYDSTGKLVRETGFSGTSERRIPFVPAGNYTLYAVDSSVLTNGNSYKTVSGLLSALSGKTEGNAYTRTNAFAVEENKITRVPELAAPLGVDESVVRRSASNVTATTNYTDYMTIKAHIELSASTAPAGAYLDLYTNQLPDDTYQGTGYMNVRSLSVNGTPVAISRWGGMFYDTQQMRDGKLRISLDKVKEAMGATSGLAFPMDLTLVIPRTDTTKTEAWMWYTANGKRGLVGVYSEQVQEATLTAPATVAWRDFSVYGNAGPNAEVNVYLDGMLAASAHADEYGFYTCQVTLPSKAYDGDVYAITASATWVDKKGVTHNATTPAEEVEYSLTTASVEEIYLFYQKDKGQTYNTLKIYDKGKLSAKYVTFYRSENETNSYDDEDADHAKYFFMAKLAHPEFAKNVQIVVPRSDEDLELQTTSSPSKAMEWIWDVRNYWEQHIQPLELADVTTQSDGVTAQAMPYGYVETGTAGRVVYDALAKGDAYVTAPVYLNYAPDEVYCMFDDVLTAPRRIPEISKLPSYTNDDLTAEELSECLTNLNQGKYLNIVEAQDDAQGNMVPIQTDAASVQKYLAASPGSVDQWLAIGTGDANNGWLKVHHVATTSAISGASEATSAISSVNAVYKSRKNLDYDDLSVRYKGNAVVDAFVDPDPQDPSYRYYVRTQDSTGNTQVEMMHEYRIGTTSKRLYSQVRFDKGSYVMTSWDANQNKRFVVSFTIDKSQQASKLTMSQLLELWHGIICMQRLGLEETSDLMGLSDADRDAAIGVVVQGSGDPKGSLQKTATGEALNQMNNVANPYDNMTYAEINFVKAHLDRQNGRALYYYGKEQKSQQGGRNLYMELNCGWAALTTKALGEIVQTGTTYGFGAAKGLEATAGFVQGNIRVTPKGKKYTNDLLDMLIDILDEEEKAKKAYPEAGVDQSDIDDDLKEAIEQRRAEREGRNKAKKSKKKKKARKSAGKGHKPTHDPSGIIYEGVLSNPVEGARAMLYTYNPAGNTAQFIDSEQFGIEPNPQITGKDGRYQWFVPEGFWQVRVTKQGYESFSTGNSQTGMNYGIDPTRDLDGDGVDDASEWWMPVLPEQLDVNIGLVSYEAPKIKSVTANKTGATVTFSKYMQVDTVKASLFTLSGKPVTRVEAQNAEAAGDGSGTMLATVFRLTYDSSVHVDPGTPEVTLVVGNGATEALSYAGVGMSASRLPYKTSATMGPFALSEYTIASIPNQTYTGKKLTPALNISYGALKLKAGVDYTVSFKNNVKVGTATVTIKGKGRCTGTVTKKFSIVPAAQSISAANKTVAMGKTVKLGATNKSSGGGALSYKSASTAIAKVSAAGVITPVKVGTTTVSITAAATSNYKATTKKVTVTVTKGTQVITVDNPECVVKKTAKLGAKASGGGKLTYKSANTKVVTVSAKGVITGKKAGTAKVTITAAANANWKKTTKTFTVKVGKANPIVAKAIKKTVVAKYNKSKAVVTAANVKVTKAQGKVTYANASTNATAAKFVVDAKTGKVTVPKKTKKGKYQVKVAATAAGNKSYVSGTKTVTYTIQVK